MIEEIDKKILTLYNLHKETEIFNADKFIIEIHELLCSYKAPFIKYETYNVDELKSYLNYKRAWEELREDNQLPIPFIELLGELMSELEEKYNLEQ